MTTTSIEPQAALAPVARMSVPTLTAMVVGSKVGAGVFSLPARRLALLPYFLAAAYALKLGLTGESYEGIPAGIRRRETVFAGVATAYTIFLFDAAGGKFLLLMTVLLAPAALLYVKERSEHGRRLFSPAEVGLFVIIVIGGISGVVGLWTGRITI